MLKILTVIGTRPEVIKLAPVIKEIERQPERLHSRTLVTGQHREMLDPMLDLFGIEPDHDLAVMQPDQQPEELIGRVLRGMMPLLDAEDPDWIVVQGDTTTVMAACLAAFFCRRRVAHVEAGLRTFDKYSPFPEELNRRIAGVIADTHFAPTPWAAANLLREGVPAERILITGNTIIDALRATEAKDIDLEASPISAVDPDARIVLVTAHRKENLEVGIERLAVALLRIASMYDDVQIVFPIHMNPNVREPVLRILGDVPNVLLLEPVAYREMVWLLHRAHVVLTDSGGIQEEAAGVGTPVLVLRETTERPEGVESGIAKLIGCGTSAVVRETATLLQDPGRHREMAEVACPYGDGYAAHRIVEVLATEQDPAAATPYERPMPEHPMDTLLRHATEEIPRRYAKKVISRARTAPPPVRRMVREQARK